MTAGDQRVYEFGECSLDVRRRELRRRNTLIKLYPKQFDVLLVLVERAGSLVSKDELMRIVWPDTVVEEGNLTAYISQLRKLLGDADHQREHIVTVPGRGYQFVATVREVTPARPAAGARRAHYLLTLGLALVVAVIAVIVRLSRDRGVSPPRYEQLTFRRGTIWTSRFAPDGRTVIYAASWDGHAPELFLTRAESPESQSLNVRDADVLSIARSGEVAISIRRRFRSAWESTGTLARIPLTGGVPHEILTGVSDADWAPDGKNLAIVRAMGGRDCLEFPVGNVLYQSGGFMVVPRVAPNGDRVAFLERAGGQESVVIVSAAGERTIVAAGQNAATGLAWSASGRELVFTVVKNGSTTLHAAAPGSDARVITRMAGEWRVHDISRDGRVLLSQDHKRSYVMSGTIGDAIERDLSWHDRSIAFGLSNDRTVLLTEVGAAAGETKAVYLRKMDGSPAIRLGDGEGWAVSPDGRWVIAVQGAAPERLVLLPTGTGQPRWLNNGAVTDYFAVRWFPDGQRIVFGGVEPGQGLRRYVQQIGGGEPWPVEWAGGVQHTPFLPDGKSYIGLVKGRGYIVDMQGGEPRPVPGWVESDLPLQVSADGRWLFVFDLRLLYGPQPEGIRRKVNRLDLTTGERQPWLTIVIPDSTGVKHPGPQFEPLLITPDGRSYVYNYLRVLSDLFLVDGLR
jgi:DNA-binding winged helix-turn-helix (wHTH) protein